MKDFGISRVIKNVALSDEMLGIGNATMFIIWVVEILKKIEKFFQPLKAMVLHYISGDLYQEKEVANSTLLTEKKNKF